MTVEERLRATTEAVTEAMRPVRPLDLRRDPAFAQPPAKRRLPRQSRRWPGWLIPVAAAMAVIAVAATLVTVRSLSAAGPGSRPAPASTATLTNGIPRYYVSLKDAGTSPKGAVERNAFLGDASTSKRLATFTPPSDASFNNVVASSDGRTFVLEALAGPGFGSTGDLKLMTRPSVLLFYLVRVTPGAAGAAPQARLTRLPIAPLPISTAGASGTGAGVLGSAVSPDGRTLALLVLMNGNAAKATASKSQLQLRTYSLATGRTLRTWVTPGASWVGPPDNLTWLDDGRTLAFVAPTVVSHGYIRTLDTAKPGTNLVADSRPVFSVPAGSACSSPLLTADGKSVICGTAAFFPNSKPACNKGGMELSVYSVVTGKLERVLYRYSSSCTWGVVQVVWAKSAALVIAAIVVTKPTPPHPQIATLIALTTPGKYTSLHATYQGPGFIAF